MLDHLTCEPVVRVPDPMRRMPGFGNDFTARRLSTNLRLARPLQPRLARVQSPYTTARVAAAVLSLLMATGCAGTTGDPQKQAAVEPTNDPAERANRAIFKVNQFADHHVLRPVAEAYKDYVPGGVQRSIHNFVGNLAEPQIALNDALQCNFGRAGKTALRFGVNTIAGVGGAFDVATGWKLPRHQADFGQTLGVWGVGPGPFVELPLFGPSNARDTVGKVAGIVTDPLTLASGGVVTVVKAGSGAFGAVDARAKLVPETDEL